jgi:poly-D-alanine transfer protein DltD
MKKIILITLITSVLIMSNAIPEKIDCTQFDKVSAKYIECSAKNLKEKSSELKLKATVGAEELKEKITTNAKSGKNKFYKLNLKEKLVKFKNSKSLTEFMEK